MSTLVTIRDAHVKDMEWAVCGSSSRNATQQVNSDAEPGTRVQLFMTCVQVGSACSIPDARVKFFVVDQLNALTG